MSFNPPPQWPVPRGWSPPPNWDPPPSWPPAPPGWTFWVEEPDTGGEEPADTTHPEPTTGAPPGSRWWRIPANVVVSIMAVAVLAGGFAFMVVDKPDTRINTQPHSESIPPTSDYTGWREPPWGTAAPTSLYVDFSAWTRFGGIDADFGDNGESVLLDTHDTTDTWHTKWSGLISPLSNTCAVRIVGRARDISHTTGVPGGFGIGLGALAPGDPDTAALSGTALQYDFGYRGFRAGIYPSDTDHAATPAPLDHQWHDIEVIIDATSHVLKVDGRTVAEIPAGGQCGHPFIRVWAGSAEFADFTVTPD